MTTESSKLPLSGLRVLAVEQYGAGPFGTSYLADLGAEIIKIENHKDGGDVGRHVGPHFFGVEDSHFFQTFNRNKKSLTLDLKHPQGKAVLQKLVGTADAVLDTRCDRQTLASRRLERGMLASVAVVTPRTDAECARAAVPDVPVGPVHSKAPAAKNAPREK